MGRVTKEDRYPCESCGHVAALHSNEACEAIRCSCRITRKMMATAVSARKTARPAVVRSEPAEPATTGAPKRAPKKRSRGNRADADDSQAA